MRYVALLGSRCHRIRELLGLGFGDGSVVCATGPLREALVDSTPGLRGMKARSVTARSAWHDLQSTGDGSSPRHASAFPLDTLSCALLSIPPSASKREGTLHGGSPVTHALPAALLPRPPAAALGCVESMTQAYRDAQCAATRSLSQEHVNGVRPHMAQVCQSTESSRPCSPAASQSPHSTLPAARPALCDPAVS